MCNVYVCLCVSGSRLLQPAQVCDVLKGFIMVLCYSMMSYVDYSMMYHLIRGQSVIKLYIIYNMLEVHPGDTSEYLDLWLYCTVCHQLIRSPASSHSSPVVLSGGRPPVLIIWPGHPGRSVLDSHRTEGEEESAHRRDSSLPHGCALCLYPHWERPVLVMASLFILLLLCASTWV